MLPLPDWFTTGWAIAAATNIAFGGLFSVTYVWEKVSPILKLGTKYGGTYLKAGEYGES